MKLNTLAIHEAGHAIMAAAHGFEIKEVYIEKERGATEIALPALSAEDKAILRKSRGDIINLDLIYNQVFPDLNLDEKIIESTDEATKNLATEIGKIADVLLAGWVAEETFAQYLSTEKYEKPAGLGAMVARASEDVGDICKIIGLSEKNTRGVMACLIDMLLPRPTDPVSQYPEPLQSFLAGESPKQFREKQLTAGLITELRDRFIRQTGWDGPLTSARGEEPGVVATWLYGKRGALGARLFRYGLTRKQCIALAKRLASKKRLTGAEALNTIKKIGEDPGAVKFLIQDLKDKDAEVASNAVKVLGEIEDADEKVANNLVKALKHPSSRVASEAASALGELGRTRAVSPLTQALKRREADVRRAAILALGHIGDTRAVKPLLLALKSPDERLRGAAISALGRLGDVRALEPLTLALQEQNGILRRDAIWALGKIGGTSVLEPIARALSDTDYFVREAARQALENIEEPQVRETLARASEDENSLVSQAAKKALENIERRTRLDSLLPSKRRYSPTSRKRRQ